jgi:hypothetical protein
MNQTDNTLLHRLLDPIGRCLTPEVASQIVNLRAPIDVQDRLDWLADRCNEGTLTAEELSEYHASVQAIDVISILQAQARSILASARSLS